MPKTIGFFGGKFLVVHKGHVHAMIQASTLVDELHVVVVYDEGYEREFYFKNGKMDPIPYHQRVRWWHEITKDLPHVIVHAIEEKQTGCFSDWEIGAEKIKKEIGKPIDVVFSSEPSYTDFFEKLYPDSAHVILDAARNLYPISATEIRVEGAMKHWEMLPDVVRPYFAKSVVVVGTESTGKSTLMRNLANIYNTKYVEEYGRSFYENIGAEIVVEDDFPKIAFSHKYLEEQGRAEANKIFFVDTEAIVTQYFSMLYCGKRLPVLDEVIKLQKYDLWLFTEPDVEWVADGYRVWGEDNVRAKNNAFLKSLLEEYGIEYKIIKGSYNERLNTALDHVAELLV